MLIPIFPKDTTIELMTELRRAASLKPETTLPSWMIIAFCNSVIRQIKHEEMINIYTST